MPIFIQSILWTWTPNCENVKCVLVTSSNVILFQQALKSKNGYYFMISLSNKICMCFSPPTTYYCMYTTANYFPKHAVGF